MVMLMAGPLRGAQNWTETPVLRGSWETWEKNILGTGNSKGEDTDGSDFNHPARNQAFLEVLGVHIKRGGLVPVLFPWNSPKWTSSTYEGLVRKGSKSNTMLLIFYAACWSPREGGNRKGAQEARKSQGFQSRQTLESQYYHSPGDPGKLFHISGLPFSHMHLTVQVTFLKILFMNHLGSPSTVIVIAASNFKQFSVLGLLNPY